MIDSEQIGCGATGCFYVEVEVRLCMNTYKCLQLCCTYDDEHVIEKKIGLPKYFFIYVKYCVYIYEYSEY